MNRAFTVTVAAVAIRRPRPGVARIVLAIGCVLAAMRAPAEARPRPSGGKPFTANKSFGVGLIVGEPTGFSAKYYLGPSTALDFALGEFDEFRDDNDLGVHVDFLLHPLVLATTDPFLLPLYFGLGGRLVDDDNGDANDNLRLGIRGPVGVELDFNRVPIDVFFELAIIIDLINDDNDDDVEVDAAIGARWYF